MRALPGGRRASTELAGVRIVIADADDPPFRVDATVHEEDTWLALSAPADVIATPGHPVRVMTNAWDAAPREPGSVIVRTGSPTRLLAVVHDLDAEPSWRLEWVAEALEGVFDEAERRDLVALRLPLLGSRHGALPPEAFIRHLRELLRQRAENGVVRRLWLLRGGQPADAVVRAITTGGEEPRSAKESGAV